MGRTSFNAVLLANLPKSRKEKKRFFTDTTFFFKNVCYRYFVLKHALG